MIIKRQFISEPFSRQTAHQLKNRQHIRLTTDPQTDMSETTDQEADNTVAKI